METENITANEIVVTERAAAEIRKIIAQNNIPEATGLRIGVKGGGCSGLSYALGFDEELRAGDVVIEQQGIRIVVDSKSLFYLTGTELDFSDGLAGRGFTFHNPNAVKTCGCGSSFGV